MMSLVRLIISNLFVAVLIAMTILFKALFHKKGSLKFHYHIWYVLLFVLILFLIPTSFLRFMEIPSVLSESAILSGLLGDGFQENGNTSVISSDWQYDFVDMVDSKTESVIISVFAMVWLFGAAIMVLFYLHGSQKLHKIKRSAGLPAEDIYAVFKQCCLIASVKNERIHLLQSKEITTPLSFGYIHLCIILPESIAQQSSQTALEHIFLHELMHIKHKDLWVNFWICLEQVLYWFHPFVWYAFSQMRRDREAYCDWLVLNFYDMEEERLCYGKTLLQFAGRKNQVRVDTANRLIDRKSQLKYRVEQIAEFKKETKGSKAIRYGTIAMLLLLSIIQIPVLAALANDFDFIYTPDYQMTVIEKDYSNLFGEISGCSIVYDLQNDIYDVYNPSAITKRMAPCSTCKIYSALNALEQCIITPENHLIVWDGINRELPAWNGNQDLNSAMAHSVNWYFQLLDEISGIEELEKFYSQIGYGNGYVGNHTESYWNGNGLKISPLEQIELLVRLYHNDFGFQEDNVQAVKDAIYLAERDGSRLYGKTGTGRNGDEDVIGWFIGFLETSDHTYFFAVSLQDDANANGAAAVQILYAILETMKIV